MLSLLTEPDSGRLHIHFIGICGTAMAGVAAELHGRGSRVTGSDASVYPPMSTFLTAAGVAVSEGYRAENLDSRPDLVVVGNAVSRGNLEVEAVLDRGLSYCSLPELLRWRLLPGKTSVVVTGTHGKTTTTALCTWILRFAGLDPSWLVGGIPVDLEKGFHLGGGQPFVLEGDEYDTAFFDKRSKFLQYSPQIVVLNNLEYDHADIYDDLEAIRRSFRQLLRVVPGTGRVLANIDDPEIRALLPLVPCPVTTYSVTDGKADWLGDASPASLAVTGPNGRKVELAHSLVGRHQAWNLLAAVAAADYLGVSMDQIREAVTAFQGVKRRAELRGEGRGVLVYDDFAHHPTALRGTLGGFRDRYPDRRIWALVEPRSNTMRRNVFQRELSEAFDAADEVCFREVPNAAKVPEGELLDVSGLARELVRRGLSARVLPDGDAIASFVLEHVSTGDVVVVLSNGGFEGIHEKLLSGLRS